MTFHLNLSTFLLDSVISPVNLFLQFSQIDNLCFITTLPPPADLVCTVHAWISSERMRRLRKSFHNLAAAVVTSFSANSGQYLASWFCWKENGFSYFFGILYWRSCSTCPFTNRLTSPRQREKTDRSLQAHSTSANTRIQTHRFYKQIDLLCFVLYNFFFSVSYMPHGKLLMGVYCIDLREVALWHCNTICIDCGILSYCWVFFPRISRRFPRISRRLVHWLPFICIFSLFSISLRQLYLRIMGELNICRLLQSVERSTLLMSNPLSVMTSLIYVNPVHLHCIAFLVAFLVAFLSE